CKETAFYRRGITESLSFHGNLNILPAYIRLRSNLDTVDAKSAAAVLKLYDRHLLQTAWHNILQSRRAKAFDLWRRASFFKDPQYWTRVFIFLIFGGKFARYLRSISKM
ncbi:hypothetical protein, partial [Blastomonas sp.]|uniref:hypothetical protein n=1 Tax=Blastomonas sp. TaxID=1909299 RepID=UPI00406A52D3